MERSSVGIVCDWAVWTGSARGMTWVDLLSHTLACAGGCNVLMPRSDLLTMDSNATAQHVLALVVKQLKALGIPFVDTILKLRRWGGGTVLYQLQQDIYSR